VGCSRLRMDLSGKPVFDKLKIVSKNGSLK
jgi:hypothetical protein